VLGATGGSTSATAVIVASCDLNLRITYTDLFDDVATQLRWFYVICPLKDFALQRIFHRQDSGLHPGMGYP
jgi:hypothetical protein